VESPKIGMARPSRNSWWHNAFWGPLGSWVFKAPFGVKVENSVFSLRVLTAFFAFGAWFHVKHSTPERRARSTWNGRNTWLSENRVAHDAASDREQTLFAAGKLRRLIP
jgi:hypothetical protein